MKNTAFYSFLILLIFLSACKGDRKTDFGSIETSNEVSGLLAEATPEEIRSEIGAENDIFNGEVLENIYSEREYEPIWTDGETLHSLYNGLKNANKEGLFFQDYHGEKIEELISSNDLEAENAARLDLFLTDAFLSYARDLYYGKLDPTDHNKLWGISRKEKDFTALLQEGMESGDIQSIFESLMPNHIVYHDLKKSLAEYEELKNDSTQVKIISEGELIKPGDKDPRIPKIAERLQGLNYDGIQTRDSIYSEELAEVIKEFQKSKSIQTDGIIGNSTISELNMGPKDRYLQILANLERWRWYPRDLGDHYIIINIPNFKLAVVKDGDTIREHNVIAGAKARQTPIFSDTINHLEINPTWTVPPTIKAKDVIPKVAADPSYISSHDMTVTGPNGEQVNPSSVDWNSDEAMNYTFTQRAGPANPLGRVKIMYPNQYLIYLHDTPSKAIFEQTDRAESSGCVRVQNAIDLSAYVVENQPEWTKEKIEETIASGKTTTVKVDRPIQVHHLYWTAWRAGGETVFTNDVYDLDKKIYTNLTARLNCG